MTILSAITRALRRRLADEQGSAMTEFVMFLPVWVILFIAVVNLGKLGIESTKVPLMVQKDLWDKVIPVSSSSYTDVDKHVNPQAAGIAAGAELISNADSVADALEGAAILGLTVGGHWGESYARVLPVHELGDFISSGSVPEPFEDPTEVIGDSVYAGHVVNDNAARSLMSAEGGMGIVIAMLGGAGLIHSKGAGIRYGMVTAKNDGYNINLAGGQKVVVKGSYDILVAPSPLTGAVAQHVPWAINRLLAETEDNYNVALRFSEMEWTDQMADVPDEYNIDPEKEINDKTDDGKKDAEKEAKKKCKNKCNTISIDVGEGETVQFYCPNYGGSSCSAGETCNGTTGACISNNP